MIKVEYATAVPSSSILVYLLIFNKDFIKASLDLLIIGTSVAKASSLILSIYSEFSLLSNSIYSSILSFTIINFPLVVFLYLKFQIFF